MAFIPNSRPQQAREITEDILKQYGVDINNSVAIVAVRGYYRDSMGVPGKNDRGIYDDAMFIISPSCYFSFNANTDPSRQYKKHLACLRTGLWSYKIGKHGYSREAKGGPPAYTALVQADDVVVHRDGEGYDRGIFYINIHRGGNTTTSSEGCQTLPPTQWDAFIATVQEQMKRYGQKTIPYLLVEEKQA